MTVEKFYQNCDCEECRAEQEFEGEAWFHEKEVTHVVLMIWGVLMVGVASFILLWAGGILP